MSPKHRVPSSTFNREHLPEECSVVSVNCCCPLHLYFFTIVWRWGDGVMEEAGGGVGGGDSISNVASRVGSPGQLVRFLTQKVSASA